MDVRGYRRVIPVSLVEHRVEQASEANGPATQRGLAFAHGAVKRTALFLQSQEFIGNIQRSKDCYTQGISRVAAGRHGAHLRVDRGRQLLNVCRVVGAKVIGLIVDIHTDGRGSAPNLEIICHVSPVERLFAVLFAEFVYLFEQPFDALPHRVPLLLQAGKLLL